MSDSANTYEFPPPRLKVPKTGKDIATYVAFLRVEHETAVQGMTDDEVIAWALEWAWEHMPR